jgi:uncharacterized membrane protein
MTIDPAIVFFFFSSSPRQQQEPHKNGVFVVQTMRNSIMSSALLALAAGSMTAAVGYALGYYGRSYVSAAGGGLELGDRQLAVRPPLKLAAALPCFVAAALCYVRSTAFYNDASFVAVAMPLAPPPDASSPPSDPPSTAHDHLTETLLWASVFRSLGTRAFSSSLPFLMWLYGPVPMLAASLLVLVFLASQDAAPDSPFHTRPPAARRRRRKRPCHYYSCLDAAFHRPDASPLIGPPSLPKDSTCIFCPHV